MADDRLREEGSGRGAATAEEGTHTQRHISPSILVYEDYRLAVLEEEEGGFGRAHVDQHVLEQRVPACRYGL